ncbi:DUF2764 family protein [Marinilabiliaceae bacterium ANBcel2]|nr:DUF2764 family protein [Marinilabiliaceae bacterium ANBcel2]
MQRNYYALVAGLPDILPDESKVAFSSVEFRDYLFEEVHPSDYQLIEMLYLSFDNENLLNQLFNSEEKWDDRGNFSYEIMEQMKDRKSYEMTGGDLLPEYMIDFLDRFHGDEQIDNYYRAEHILSEGYNDLMSSCSNRYLRDVSSFQRNISNIMTALNSRKYDVEFSDTLIGDDEVVSALKKSRMRDFGLSNEVNDIEELIQIFEIDNITERELKLDKYQWQYFDEITFFNYFTIEKVLAFLQKMFIVERWMKLDSEKGKEMFNQLLKDLEADFQFPEEFTLAYGKR